MPKHETYNPDLLHPELSHQIIGAAFDVHNELGPGWDEWDYHRAILNALQIIPFADDIQYFIKAGWKPAVRIAGFQPALSLNRVSCVFGIRGLTAESHSSNRLVQRHEASFCSCRSFAEFRKIKTDVTRSSSLNSPFVDFIHSLEKQDAHETTAK